MFRSLFKNNHQQRNHNNNHPVTMLQSSSLNLMNRPLDMKTHPILNDYDITDKTLGLGINGKVVECYNKKSNQKYALKVCLCFN